jgi:hypothetical protein
MTSTEFLASRKSKIVLVGSAIIGAAAPLLGHFLERLKTKSSEPNAWAPYFARETDIRFSTCVSLGLFRSMRHDGVLGMPTSCPQGARKHKAGSPGYGHSFLGIFLDALDIRCVGFRTGQATPNKSHDQLGPGTEVTGYPTDQELSAVLI